MISSPAPTKPHRPLRGLLALLGLSLAVGCQTIDYYPGDLEPAVSEDLAPPKELAMSNLPPYRVEPPDLLQIEVLKMVPKPPYRVDAYDVLELQVVGTLLDQPIAGYYLVEAEGVVDLGAAYGKVRVAGMTVDQITTAVTAHLRQILREPVVSVKLARASGMQPISGVYLIGPDGMVNLRQYGSVHVAGRTLPEVEAIVREHLAQFLDSPDVAVDVAANNSKVYYLITEGPDLGDSLRRLPVTGNETVLDAVSQVGGLSRVSGSKVWIARPAPGGQGCERILPVDWDGLVSGATARTNYQILPGDRVFIAADPATVLANRIGRVVGPARTVAEFAALSRTTIVGLQLLGRQANRRRIFSF